MSPHHACSGDLPKPPPHSSWLSILTHHHHHHHHRLSASSSPSLYPLCNVISLPFHQIKTPKPYLSTKTLHHHGRS
ncbi:hypothetical protein L249_2030 [Ophiocordyceps polyrhachis-furcata BCC 54312]|uniref:Uncharacterized protein n=1 Tax=Ophiocordyceps polyrhachis-furcata BCC 54312 TaxID=1330021 RepID=A0A367LN95_9HYPO|nr:hypothetical protein L249_2030 [Ophiocordyceps polyrhachis-furcata BCC 54312]